MRTSVFRTAALAVKNVLLAALGDRQQVAAVCAENEGSDGSHFGFLFVRLFVCAGMVICLDRDIVGSVFLVVFVRSKQFAGMDWGPDFKIYNGPCTTINGTANHGN